MDGKNNPEIPENIRKSLRREEEIVDALDKPLEDLKSIWTKRKQRSIGMKVSIEEIEQHKRRREQIASEFGDQIPARYPFTREQLKAKLKA